MTIADAARATRKWRYDYSDHTLYAEGERSIGVERDRDLEAACDRLNLLAVLEAIREPSERMVDAIGVGTVETDANRWRAMIDALIAEVREAGNDA